MNEKIDLTEILKYCPVGWELYSSVLGEVSFKEITDDNDYPITVDCENWGSESFTAEGKLYIKDNANVFCFRLKTNETGANSPLIGITQRRRR